MATKKQKLDNEHNDLSFKGFKTEKILMNDVKSKRVHVLGKFKDSDEKAIITLCKPAFTEEIVKSILSEDTVAKVEFCNDIYGQYVSETKPNLNRLTTNTIYPATEKHIMKYTAQDIVLLDETPADYDNITVPFLQKQLFSVNWVYNILDHEKESERILYEDPDKEHGFIILPDLKWDGKQIEDLYLSGIFHARNIKSLRDLNNSHLPMLKMMLEKGLTVIEEKFGVPRNEIRVYFHYYPTYYHLHVHFNHLKNDPGGIHVGKAHLLQDVINNIETFGSSYYAKKTLSVTLRQRDPLLKLLLDWKNSNADTQKKN